jgi:hypothetical protein
MTYLGLNSSTYFTSTGETGTPVAHTTASDNNATIFAINPTTGAVNWKYFVPLQGYRGGVITSGNLVYATLSSGDILMINAANGSLARDYFIGAPMDELATIGATTTGQEMLVVPVGTCSFEAVATCPGTTAGDVIALTLTTPPPSSSGKTATVTSTATTTASGSGTVTTVVSGGTTVTTVLSGGTTVTTVVSGAATGSTVTVSGSTGTVTVASTVTTSTGGVSSAALYGVAVVAVIFIIATGYLAMRGRKPST